MTGRSALRALAILAGSALAACTQTGKPDDAYPPIGAIPVQVTVAERVISGNSMRFTGDGQTLTLEIFPAGQGKPDEVYREDLTAAEWEVFRRAVITAQLAQWEPDYTGPTVPDGREWSVAIDYPSWKVRSSGSNAWPDDDRFSGLWRALVVLVDFPYSKVP